MNVFIQTQTWLEGIIGDYLKTKGISPEDAPDLTVETPRQREFGDISLPIAMQLARPLKRAPFQIAEEIAACLPANDLFSKVDVVKPGFINFTLSDEALFNLLREVEAKGIEFARGVPVEKKNVMVEFVSANPTGPLHMGHARNAVVGDTLARVLAMGGHDVHREYYYNDAGVQMDNLGKSLKVRYLQECGHDVEFPEDGYQGSYMIDIARDLKNEKGESLVDEEGNKIFTDYAADHIIALIAEDLRRLDIEHDQYFSETTVHDNGEVEEALAKLREVGYVYEKDGAEWVRSTQDGDDQDRVVVKSDGNYTYLAPDVAYHLDKAKRGYNLLVNIWGADHAGYVARLRGAFAALGYPKEMIECVIIQLVREKNQPKLSTRRGEFVSLIDVIEDLGKDVIRFLLLMRSVDNHMEFDWALARDTSDKNPVYKCQYAHARMCSLFRKSEELGIKWDSISGSPLDLLKAPEEKGLIRTIALMPEIVRKSCLALEPQPLTTYALQLANEFNQWFSLGNTDVSARVILPDESELTRARLALVKGVQIALQSTLKLLGVDAPERM